MKKRFKKSGNNKGFTIIELVISISILAIAIVGIFNALSIIIVLTSDASDRLSATYLAQEGMEIVRNIRDTNWLYMNNPPQPPTVYSWIDGLTPAGSANSENCILGQPCEADYTSKTLSPGQDYLYLNGNGFYFYTSDPAAATPTKFQRKINVTPVDDVTGPADSYHILKVKVAVSWDKKATVLSKGVSADHCCPDAEDVICTTGISNCVITEGTLYNWYNTAISVVGVSLSDSNGTNLAGNYPIELTPSVTSDTLTANLNPTNATIQDVRWENTDESCINLTSHGLTAGIVVAHGTASTCHSTVTVTTADGGWSATADVNVTRPTP